MQSSRSSALILAVVATTLAGCSNAGELRTASQSSKFIVAAVQGRNIAGWHLASGASGDATRVWAERGTIQDLGRRLRSEGLWACEFAEAAGVLGTGGPFTGGDRNAVTQIARGRGAPPGEIDALLSDVLRIANPDLVKATKAVCG